MTRLILPLLALAGFALSDSDPWNPGQILSPATLADALKGHSPPRILQVGFGVQYRSKHIPNSEYAGPGSKPEGLEALKKAVAQAPKNQPIAIYCGCCPWDHCPNIRPAFKELQSLGFTDIRILSIPTNFTKDWLDRGYPFEPGSAAK